MWGAIALELGGGAMLIAGLLTRLISLALFVYLLVLAVVFHHYWTMTGGLARVEHAAFFEHLGMAGGMLYVVAFGAGAYSLDALIFRARAVPQPASRT